jgi:hypothetical protein
MNVKYQHVFVHQQRTLPCSNPVTTPPSNHSPNRNPNGKQEVHTKKRIARFGVDAAFLSPLRFTCRMNDGTWRVFNILLIVFFSHDGASCASLLAKSVRNQRDWRRFNSLTACMLCLLFQRCLSLFFAEIASSIHQVLCHKTSLVLIGVVLDTRRPFPQPLPFTRSRVFPSTNFPSRVCSFLTVNKYPIKSSVFYEWRYAGFYIEELWALGLSFGAYDCNGSLFLIMNQLVACAMFYLLCHPVPGFLCTAGPRQRLLFSLDPLRTDKEIGMVVCKITVGFSGICKSFVSRLGKLLEC